MNINLGLNIKQETKNSYGTDRSNAELFAERIFSVKKVNNTTEVYDHKNNLLTTLGEDNTTHIFKTERITYPAIYNYKTGELVIVKYVPLHGHSSFSILDCISKPEDIANKGELAVAVTDHGNMFGSLKFYKAMKKEGKKPIIGFEAYMSSMDYHYKTKKDETLHVIAKRNHVSVESLFEHNPTLHENLEVDELPFEDLMILCLKEPEKILIAKEQDLLIHKSNAKNHLVLLAKDEQGYKNLVKLTSAGQSKYRRGRPQIDWEDLKEYNEGIVALSACLAGELPRAVLNDDVDHARTIIKEMIKTVGKDNYYIEIQRHGIDEERVLNPILLSLAEEFDLKVVATADNHFTNKDDASAHEAHLCIGTKSELDDPNRWVFPGSGYHIHSSEEMSELFHDIPFVLDNTLDLADKLNCVIPMGEVHMPEFPVPTGYKEQSDYFIELVRRGFKDRFEGTPAYTDPEYIERIKFEIETINNMDYPGYFLIVADFVNYAKRNYHLFDKSTTDQWKRFMNDNNYDPIPISVGPGRGSACGSLVAFCLHITNVDPIPYGLLFERFLNPDRISMPDIDMDFPDTRREEILEYVRELYGEEAVSGIVTLGTMGAKMVVRDVARVMGYPTAFGNKISKMIPEKISSNGKNLKVNLQNCVDYDLSFSQIYQSDTDFKRVVDMAIKLEGLPRNTSQHACGFLISPSAVTNYIPQATVANKETKKRDTVTQYTMSECEDMGLLKMDFLGLRTMGVIDRAMNLANEKRAEEGRELLNINSLSEKSMADLNVYRFIGQGYTAGVFQLESPGMTDVMTKLFQDVSDMDPNNPEDAVECFERLVAGISLYRPGPMDEIPSYIENMLNPEEIVYDSEELKKILSATYNVIVYQEQVMFIVRELAGFSRGESDNIRKAMGKKDKEIIDRYKNHFLYGSKEQDIKGCEEIGIPIELAKDIWDRMEKFAEYAFNKSHAVGYANISVMNAYLAYYYPKETMCEILNSYKKSADRIKQFIGVCKARNIKVLPPDLNTSRTDFYVEDEGILFGFNGLKNMGKSGVLIIEEREARGKFVSLFDFVQRMATHQRIDKRMLESLIYSGSLDKFEGTRKEKFAMLDILLGIASSTRESNRDNTFLLFNSKAFKPTVELLTTPTPLGEINPHEKLLKEKEYTGFYVTGHPIDNYKSMLSRLNVEGLNKIDTFLDVDDDVLIAENQVIERKNKDIDTRLVGVVQEIEVFTTRKGDQMAGFEIEDETGVIKAVVFPREYLMYSHLLKEGNVIAFGGQVSYSERGTQFKTQLIETIEELASNTQPNYIQLTLSDEQSKAIQELKEIDDILNEAESGGIKNNIPVVFEMNKKTFRKRKGVEVKGNWSGDTLRNLELLLGMDSVHVAY